MSDNFFNMIQAMGEARETLAKADVCASQLARILVGRLRQVNKNGGFQDTELLIELKRELKDFNSRTGKWK